MSAAMPGRSTPMSSRPSARGATRRCHVQDVLRTAGLVAVAQAVEQVTDPHLLHHVRGIAAGGAVHPQPMRWTPASIRARTGQAPELRYILEIGQLATPV